MYLPNSLISPNGETVHFEPVGHTVLLRSADAAVTVSFKDAITIITARKAQGWE
jgi:hypothetical protein